MWQKRTWFEFTLSSKNSQKNVINAGCGQDQVMLLSEYRDILYFVILLGCRNAERIPMPPASTACTVGSRDMDLGEGTIGHLFSCPPTWTAQQLCNHWCSWDWRVTKNCAVPTVCAYRGDRRSAPQGESLAAGLFQFAIEVALGRTKGREKKPWNVGYGCGSWPVTLRQNHALVISAR